MQGYTKLNVIHVTYTSTIVKGRFIPLNYELNIRSLEWDLSLLKTLFILIQGTETPSPPPWHPFLGGRGILNMVISNKCFQQNNLYLVTQFLLAYGLLPIVMLQLQVHCWSFGKIIHKMLWIKSAPILKKEKQLLHTHRI